MRDLIWTIIAIWLVWKLIEIFKNTGNLKAKNEQASTINNTKSHYNSTTIEDVDYEEIK